MVGCTLIRGYVSGDMCMCRCKCICLCCSLCRYTSDVYLVVGWKVRSGLGTPVLQQCVSATCRYTTTAGSCRWRMTLNRFIGNISSWSDESSDIL